MEFLSVHVIVSDTVPISLSISKPLAYMEIILIEMASYLNPSTN